MKGYLILRITSYSKKNVLAQTTVFSSREKKEIYPVDWINGRHSQDTGKDIKSWMPLSLTDNVGSSYIDYIKSEYGTFKKK